MHVKLELWMQYLSVVCNQQISVLFHYIICKFYSGVYQISKIFATITQTEMWLKIETAINDTFNVH